MTTRRTVGWFSRVLEQAGYPVVEVSDGREALRHARRRPMLIVLDIKLPDISGFDVCRQLKADPDLRTIPVLQTSATFLSTERKVDGLDSGADACLAHPIEPPELIATVRSLLRAYRDKRGLQEAGDEWVRTFDAIADGVAILDSAFNTIRCNSAMCGLAGRRKEDLVGQPAAKLLPQDGSTINEVVAGAFARGHRTVSELSAQNRLFRIVADPILDREGAVERLVLIVSDITERRRLEADHRERGEQLAELARRKDEFLGMLAHELRNPLNAIAAANSLMDRVGSQDARNVRLRSTISRQTRALARLVDDLLEVSRVTRGKMRLQRAPTDLVSIVRGAIDNSRPAIEARNQNLDVTLPSKPLPIHADALRLEQVFGNLLQNASKYSDPGARIAIECGQLTNNGAERGCVRVRDEGVGIPPEKLEPIFDLFFQVDQTLARSLGGLGLGLTIARRLVELHAGTIRAASEGAGKGAEFIVELPLAPEAESESARPDADAIGEPTAPLTILVIEDNRDARETLHAWLEDLGHRVFEAPDGLDGLELARSIRPDVALVDIGLPGVDGYQVAKNLRESPECQGALLIAITGYGRPEDSARAREAGFDVHLVKPVQPERLALALRARALRSKTPDTIAR